MIDIKREEEIEALDKYYGGLIDEIRRYQKECIDSPKEMKRNGVSKSANFSAELFESVRKEVEK